MPLLSSSETLSFNAFLSSVDHSHDVEISPDVANQISITKGKHALTRATKDLMSLGNLAQSPSRSSSSRSLRSGAGSTTTNAGTSGWPSFSPNTNDNALARSRRSSHSIDPQLRHDRSAYSPMHAESQSQILSIHSLASDTPSYTLPPIKGDLLHDSGLDNPARNSLITSASAPSVLDHSASGSSSKRSLPDDPGPSSSKRARVSAPKTRRQSNATSSSASTPTSVPGTMSGILVGKAAKPALLTPEEKRANHIQSEQKRRANIRKGYEALCVSVPALREAIAQEEVNSSGATIRVETEVKGRKRRKKSEDNAIDGRAGPKSENIVLQKTIDYIHSLLSDHETLTTRLQAAREVLGEGHPALVLDSEYRDATGVPLWEREWNGGTGSTDDGGDEEEGEGASEDEG